MMPANVRARREAPPDRPTHDPLRERPAVAPAPKEQPPRKLSGKRTAMEMKFWKVA